MKHSHKIVVIVNMKCIYLFAVCLVLLAIFTSCVYFNTYYNAEKYFESAQKRPLSAQGRPSTQAIDEYNKVIQKCGFIITEYKNSKWVDDSVFLLAKALYYRGNNQIQAQEKFEDIINFYPNSPFFHDSLIFSARIKYELNQKEDAYTTLRDFIANNAYHEHHPKALLEIAELYSRDNNQSQSQFYLTQLIERFPKSEHFVPAYILLGKSYFDIQNYAKSLEVFTDLLKQQKVPKALFNDALYYIAYNHFYLSDYQTAYTTIRNLERREFRSEKVNEQSLLHARILAEIDELDEAIEKFESVVTNAPRTLLSAEAVYYLADLYFRKMLDYELAIENYNRVRRELATSPFAERAVTRSAVASQILQYYKKDSNLSTQQLINEQLKLAEFYLYELAQPDSALVIYASIPQQTMFIQAEIDSLETFIFDYEQTQVAVEAEGASPFPTLAEGDSLAVSEQEEETETEATETAPTVDINQARTRLASFENDLVLYNTQFIPHSFFATMVIYKQFYDDEEKVNEYYELLRNDYPTSRYTEAATEFINGESVTFLTKREKYEKSLYDYAMDNYHAGLLSANNAISILDSLTTSNMEDLVTRSYFTLGFLYFFDLGDTVSAKVYLDTLYVAAPSSPYTTFAKKFYNGQQFLIYDRLQFFIEDDIRQANIAAAEAARADSLAGGDTLLVASADSTGAVVGDETPPPTETPPVVAVTPPPPPPPVVETKPPVEPPPTPPVVETKPPVVAPPPPPPPPVETPPTPPVVETKPPVVAPPPPVKTKPTEPPPTPPVVETKPPVVTPPPARPKPPVVAPPTTPSKPVLVYKPPAAEPAPPPLPPTRIPSLLLPPPSTATEHLTPLAIRRLMYARSQSLWQ